MRSTADLPGLENCEKGNGSDLSSLCALAVDAHRLLQDTEMCTAGLAGLGPGLNSS